jgi:hypothetical protein
MALGEPVEVRTEVGGVVVTVRPEPAAGGGAVAVVVDAGPETLAAPAPKLQLGGGRDLPPLLFVTNLSKLVKQIGVREAELAISLIQAAGQRLLNVSGDNVADAAESVGGALETARLRRLAYHRNQPEQHPNPRPQDDA